MNSRYYYCQVDNICNLCTLWKTVSQKKKSIFSKPSKSYKFSKTQKFKNPRTNWTFFVLRSNNFSSEYNHNICEQCELFYTEADSCLGPFPLCPAAAGAEGPLLFISKSVLFCRSQRLESSILMDTILAQWFKLICDSDSGAFAVASRARPFCKIRPSRSTCASSSLRASRPACTLRLVWVAPTWLLNL